MNMFMSSLAMIFLALNFNHLAYAQQGVPDDSVVVYAVPPAPVITAPGRGQWFRVRNITAAGRCQTGSTVNIFGGIANAPRRTNCVNGRFSTVVSLADREGGRRVRFTQTNVDGTSVEDSRMVYLDRLVPGAPTITSPANNSSHTQRALTIAGACENNAQVLIAGNIEAPPATVACVSGRYSRAVNLTAGVGRKSLTVTQRDRAGHVSQARNLVVNFATPSPTPNPNPTWGSRNSSRMLLSGHSLMDNPLVNYVQDIAQKSPSSSFNYNQQIVIGSPIRIRTKGGNTNSTSWPGYSAGKNKNTDNLNMISEVRNPRTLGAGERYDTLIITENHSSLSQIQWENTMGYLRHYQDLMISANPATRTFFYHSWLDVNKSNPAEWINHEKNAAVTWECVASKVNASIQSINRADRIRLLPAGGALVNLVERIVAGQVAGFTGTTNQRLNLIFSDNVHLTNLGAYYMALVVYSSIYGKPVGNIAPPSGSGVTLAQVQALAPIAWSNVNAYYSQASNPTARTMSACRTFIANNMCSSYWNLVGSPGEVSNCRNFYQNDTQDNPFSNALLRTFPAAW